MQPHLKHILWPTDFSSLSLEAAGFVRWLCQTCDAALHVIHVVPPPMACDVAVALPAEMPLSYSEPELLDACRSRLDEVVRGHFGDLANVTRDVLHGNPWPVICEYAGQAHIDLVVVSTHGRTGLTHMVIGSTAERIVQHAPCPVLVVKSRSGPEQTRDAGEARSSGGET